MQEFHKGVNIIRGQNGSGKSTIADFIFFILGGEFDDWKSAASSCDEVQAEVVSTRGTLTLKRSMIGRVEPVYVYFGPLLDALSSTDETWRRYPLRRSVSRESFSQLIFRSIGIPESQSEGSSNVTMHQLLRLCYADQRTPAQRLFRFEQFDPHGIREVVGDLICGINEYELYDIGLELREKENELKNIDSKLSALKTILDDNELFSSPNEIDINITRLNNEKSELAKEIEDVDQHIEQGDVKSFVEERSTAKSDLISKRNRITELETENENIVYELREIRQFVNYLSELTEKLKFTEATHDVIGSIEFTHCPACNRILESNNSDMQCVVCKSPLDSEQEQVKYNQIRFDLEIQVRESYQLIEQKESDRRAKQLEITRLKSDHRKDLSAYEIQFGGASGPREEFLALRTRRVGHIDAEIQFLEKGLIMADELDFLMLAKATLDERIEKLRVREKEMRQASKERRPKVLDTISSIAVSMLRNDLPRQQEFVDASRVDVDFSSNSIYVDKKMNFAESSNVVLKNATLLAILLAAGVDEQFYHPRFLLIDNVEDKGMQEERSHRFQVNLVEHAKRSTLPYQVIYTTSMMNPELDTEDYTVGPLYTNENRSLALENDR